MLCKNCNKEISDDSNFCIFCDAPVNSNRNNNTSTGNNFNNQTLQQAQPIFLNFKKYVPILFGVIVLSIILLVISKKVKTDSLNSSNQSYVADTATVTPVTSTIVPPTTSNEMIVDTTTTSNDTTVMQDQTVLNQQDQNDITQNNNSNDSTQQESPLQTNENVNVADKLQQRKDNNNSSEENQQSNAVTTNNEVAKINNQENGSVDSRVIDREKSKIRRQEDNNRNSEATIQLNQEPASWTPDQRAAFMKECLAGANKFGYERGGNIVNV